LFTVFAIGALTVLIANKALVVTLAVLLGTACLLAVTTLPRELAPKGQICFHHHLVNGLSANLTELKSILAAFTVAVDAE
jgi:hypothetical protein